MQPQKLVSCLQNLQATSNAMTIANMNLSRAIGEYLKSISDTGDQDLCNPSEQAAFLGDSIKSCSIAMGAFCDASAALYALINGGGSNE